MKALLTLAALVLTSTPAVAQESDARADLDAVTACLNTTSTTLAKASKEPADVLADLTVYRCSIENKTIGRAAALRVLNGRMIALDAIVKARSGV